jgi:hypothetical protein
MASFLYNILYIVLGSSFTVVLRVFGNRGGVSGGGGGGGGCVAIPLKLPQQKKILPIPFSFPSKKKKI